MNSEQWLSQVPASIKDDALWNFQVYPKSLLVTDLAWEDCEKIDKGCPGEFDCWTAYSQFRFN